MLLRLPFNKFNTFVGAFNCISFVFCSFALFVLFVNINGKPHRRLHIQYQYAYTYPISKHKKPSHRLQYCNTLRQQ